MKKLIVSALLIFIVCVAAAQSKQEKTVAATVEKLRMAMIDANKTELEKLVAEKLSQIYHLPIEEIAQITTENSKAVFGV